MLRAVEDTLVNHQHLPVTHNRYSNNYMGAYTCRDPWTRAVSSYQYLSNTLGIIYNTSFKDFIMEFPQLPSMMTGPHKQTVNMYMLPQSWFIDEYHDKYQQLRYENLEHDFNELVKRYNIKHKPMQHLNASDAFDHKQWYDDHTMNRIGEMYKQDIERFEYTF